MFTARCANMQAVLSHGHAGQLSGGPTSHANLRTLNSAYNEVAFNEKSAITKENLCTKYTPFTYKYIVLNENPPITKQNLVIDGVECMLWLAVNK